MRLKFRASTKFVHRAKRLCKCFVELDRNMAATERNYISFLLAMNPCWTPKNDVIFGYPVKRPSLQIPSAINFTTNITMERRRSK